MEINDKIQYYIDRAIREQYHRDEIKRVVTVGCVPPKNLYLRALELACADLEATEMSLPAQNAEEKKAWKAIRSRLEKEQECTLTLHSVPPF